MASAVSSLSGVSPSGLRLDGSSSLHAASTVAAASAVRMRMFVVESFSERFPSLPGVRLDGLEGGGHSRFYRLGSGFLP